MLYLEGWHNTVAENIAQMLTSEKISSKLFSVYDFHGTLWKLYRNKAGDVYVCVHLVTPKKILKKVSVMEGLEKFYGKDVVCADGHDYPEELDGEPDFALHYKDENEWRGRELTKKEKEELEALCKKYAYLYTACMISFFKDCFSRANEGETFDPIKLPYRSNESLYVAANKDNVEVTTCMRFVTDDDLLFGKVFLQEFADAKKSNRNLAGAPSCSFSVKMPAGLSGAKNVDADDDKTLWVTFILFRKHTDTADATVESTVEKLLSFRNYVNYHIKCSKTFFHSRMRSRHTSLLQVCV